MSDATHFATRFLRPLVWPNGLVIPFDDVIHWLSHSTRAVQAIERAALLAEMHAEKMRVLENRLFNAIAHVNDAERHLGYGSNHLAAEAIRKARSYLVTKEGA